MPGTPLLRRVPQLVPIFPQVSAQNLIVKRHHFHRSSHVRFEPPGGDCVHLNIVWRELNRHGFGQLDNRSFRGTVRGDEARTEERVHTAYVDNLSLFPADHSLRGNLGKKKDCIELRCEHAVPVLRSFVHDPPAQRHVPGVIDQDVYSPQFVLDSVKRWPQCLAFS